MATYTAAQLKEYTSVGKISNWSDDKILLYQSMAESILDGLNLDTAAIGYAAAYNSAVVLLFDWLAENPTGLKARGAGKVSTTFTFGMLPGTVQAVLRKFTSGPDGTLSPAHMQRDDIGLR